LSLKPTIGNPGNPGSDGNPTQPAEALTQEGVLNVSEPDKIERAKIRSSWLDKMLADNKWTSYLDIASNGGPTYNTIRKYREGWLTARTRYVRQKLAEAFGCDISSVPE
jgi:hypothetical protein